MEKKNRIQNKIESQITLNRVIRTKHKAILFLVGFDNRSHSKNNIAFFTFKSLSKKMAPGREVWFKTARYLATCYFCKETIECAASAADKNRMFLPLTSFPRAFFTGSLTNENLSYR